MFHLLSTNLLEISILYDIVIPRKKTPKKNKMIWFRTVITSWPTIISSLWYAILFIISFRVSQRNSDMYKCFALSWGFLNRRLTATAASQLLVFFRCIATALARSWRSRILLTVKKGRGSGGLCTVWFVINYHLPGNHSFAGLIGRPSLQGLKCKW